MELKAIEASVLNFRAYPYRPLSSSFFWDYLIGF